MRVPLRRTTRVSSLWRASIKSRLVMIWSLLGKALRGVFRLHETTEMRPVFGRGLASPVRHATRCRYRCRYWCLYVGTGHRHVRVRFQDVFRAPLAQAGSRGTFARSGIAARGGVARGILLRRSDLVRATLNRWIPVAVRLASLICLVRGAAYCGSAGTAFGAALSRLKLTIYTQIAKCQ